MEEKDFLKRVYRKFSQFVEISASKELQYLILDSKFTNKFSSKIKEITKGIYDKQTGIIFDTSGNIAVIDSDVLGRFIGDSYYISMEKYYKDVSLNKIVREVVNGSEKSKTDFIKISYAILYNSLGVMYREIKCRRELIERLRQRFFLNDYQKDDIPIIILSLMIVEDISVYLNIPGDVFLEEVKALFYKKFSSS